jgi:predicted ATP-binding protein involved in virulence
LERDRALRKIGLRNNSQVRRMMKLEKLVIKGLFDHFQHTVTFNQEEGITIITAPNGYGKTMILTILDSIFQLRLNDLIKLEFDSIELLTGESKLTIEKNINLDDDKPSISILSDQGFHETVEYQENDLKDKKESTIDGESLRDIIIGNFEDNLEKVYFSENIQKKALKEKKDKHNHKYPEWLINFSKSIKTYLIQDQRLILRDHRLFSIEYTDTIEKYANDLANYIRNTVVESSQISQKLDSSFPVRLIKENSNFNQLSLNDLKENLRWLQEKREKLASYNLLASEDNTKELNELNEIQETDIKVLTLYVKDTKEKLAVYDELLKRVELFADILNNKRLSFKKVKIDADKGFIFETDQGKPLQLTQLSSGEQHQIVILYELIFNIEENGLVLIDEPEISLHVAWQKEFLQDLQKIIEIQKMSVVIATHSPQIIDTRWDLTVDLEAGAMT